ncbi:hypothetical protein COOONC_13858, partial [Cooperia oncophora]
LIYFSIRNYFRDQSPHRRREKLFHTLIFSIATFFVSVLGQTYIEIAVFWVDDREEVANLSKWYHIARIAAFVDPVLNPLIVVARTPALRRQLRAQWTSLKSRASSRTTKSRRSGSERASVRRTESQRNRCDVEVKLIKPDRPVRMLYRKKYVQTCCYCLRDGSGMNHPLVTGFHSVSLR